MQRKAYVTGTAALLAALLAGCTSGSGDKGTTDDANPGDAGTATAVAQPGKYRTLPEACGAIDHSTLDSLLPGVKQIADPEQQDKAYQGEATLTYDTDRKVGCRWKVDSTDATDHLLVDFERVVSYDNAVSDDSQAEKLFGEQQVAAGLPAPQVTESGPGSASGSASGSPSVSSSASVAGGESTSTVAPSATASPSTSSASPSDSADLQPRVLDDLGDEAFIDDQLTSSGSTAQQRTVTVVFRTSNVIVTIEYAEQPMAIGVAPDSEEMQDRARNLAAELDDVLGG
ncbi:DUF3558 domain-containing protein [Streptomyces sp. NPDC020298]|uniref:DUF3558 domain-containing protein n=1 Tax=unclassified Streptomyces TaxID=2593676 RepID=UPI0033DE5E43